MVEEPEKQLEKTLEEKTKSKEKLFRILGFIISAIVLIILIVIKSTTPTFPLFVFIGGIVVIVIFFFGMFWGFSLYRRYQEMASQKDKEGKLPPAITLEQAEELIKQLLVRPTYSDYSCGWLQHRVYVVGEHQKNRILLVHLAPTPYSSSPHQFIIMNLHTPKELYAYVTQNKYNPGELLRIVNSLSMDPKESPDMEKRIETNLQTGVQTEYVKHTKHEKEKQEKKKEDLD